MSVNLQNLLHNMVMKQMDEVNIEYNKNKKLIQNYGITNIFEIHYHSGLCQLYFE